MLVHRAILVVACTLLAAVASAEENCGSMVRTVSRFRGTVRTVEIQEHSFLVSIDVVSVEGSATAPRAGERLNFTIHSPSQTFGPESPVGRTFDLQAERMECDGTFRRLLNLDVRPPRPIIAEFGGWLDVGHTYRARTTWQDDGLTITEPLRLPMHHEGGVVFTNLDDFPIEKNRHLREIVFEVTAVHIQQIAEMQWESTYDLRILSAR